jgi:hypothetical protein
MSHMNVASIKNIKKLFVPKIEISCPGPTGSLEPDLEMSSIFASQPESGVWSRRLMLCCCPPLSL